MLYKKQNAGLLNLENVKDGDKVKIIEEPYTSYSTKTEKEYWNAKVEIPDGSHKLAGLMAMTGDMMLEAWGEETKDWIGKTAIVDVRTGQYGEYIVLIPEEKHEEVMSQKKAKEEFDRVTANPPKYPDAASEGINPDDIPFS